jgi:hypothetical protein
MKIFLDIKDDTATFLLYALKGLSYNGKALLMECTEKSHILHLLKGFIKSVKLKNIADL